MSSEYSIEQAKEDWEPVEILSGAVKFKSREKIDEEYRIRFARGKNVDDAYTRLTPPKDNDIVYTDDRFTEIKVM